MTIYLCAYPAGSVVSVRSFIHRRPLPGVICYTYVIDSPHHLSDSVSLEDLILAHPDARVELLMHCDIIAIGQNN